MKKIIAMLTAASLPIMGMAQAAVDLGHMSELGLHGTARFVSMAGAFTALGGDLSTLSQNPGGIGIYRSSEVGITMDLNFQKFSTNTTGNSWDKTQTKFNINNFGYVGTVKLYNDAVPTLSFGVTYQRANSFDRLYQGRFGSLNGASLSNYIATDINNMGNGQGTYPYGDLTWYDDFNPYLDGNAPWLGILGYQGFVINTKATDPDQPTWYEGLAGDGTVGQALYNVREKGYVDEYNVSFGGNIYNTLYWGLSFGITDIDYTQSSYYEENLKNAYIAARAKASGAKGTYDIVQGQADYALTNYLHSSGSGFNLKFGLIYKPINEFRIGFAVHTPTWYSMTDRSWGLIDYEYTPASDAYEVNKSELDTAPLTNNTTDNYFDYHMRTPWRFMVGAAGVIGGQGIISVDYEYRGNNMQVSDIDGNEYGDVTQDVKTYFKPTNIIRVGAEYRVTPQFSLRAGYSYETSPVKSVAADDQVAIWTAGTIPSYTLNKSTSYITAGLGYRVGRFYVDLAYVNKHRESTYHAFSPIVDDAGRLLQESPRSTVKSNYNQVVLGIGYKF